MFINNEWFNWFLKVKVKSLDYSRILREEKIIWWNIGGLKDLWFFGKLW